VVTQADVDAGSYTNTATGDSDQTPPGSDDETVVIAQNPALSVAKTLTASGPFGLGDTLSYDIVVTNTGNVTLTQVSVTDPNAVLGACTPAQPAALAPGAVMTCPATHVVTQADVDAGSYTNTATGDSDQTSPGSDDETVVIAQNPGIMLVKTGTLNLGADNVATAGDVITYAFTVTNTGNVTLTNVTVSDPLITILGVPIALLVPGASDSTTFTGSYILTQADINSGAFTNIATASGTPPTGGDVSDTDDDTQPLIAAPLLGLAKHLVGAPQQVSTGVWDVTFDLIVENYGNVPLTNLQVTDNLATTFPLPTTFTVQSLTSSSLTVNWPGYNGSSNTNLLTGADALAVGQSSRLQLVVRVTPAAAGPFENSALASGTPPGGGTTTDDSQDGIDPDPDNDGNPGNNDDPTPVVFGGSLFDPPFGIKVVTETGESLLRWTMVWINDSNIVAVNAQASDEIPLGTTFVDNGVPSGYPLPADAPAGSLASGVTCSDTSALTSTQYCYYEGPTAAYARGRIIWRGVLGPDFGALDAESAANEIAISFTVRVNGGVTDVHNTAYIDSDINGDGDVSDAGEQQVAAASEGWVRPVTSIEELPETGFRPGMFTSLPAQPLDLRYAQQDLRLEIPALGVDIPVVGVPQSGGGWDVTWLGGSAGWLNGTAYPTWNGNSVLTAHVWDALNQPGPFAGIRKLKYGDQVRIHAFGMVYVYEVRENRLVQPDETGAVLKHEEKPWLTLLTCENFSDSFDTYANRRMVRAVLVRVVAEK
jgi:LPXTG-site transpeptidase (sortase) family protein